ncbi:GNAT family N-acetyltransferase [Nocardiopsis sp. NPDC055551]
MEITRLAPENETEAAALLAHAMHHDPLFVWLFPDSDARASLLGHVMAGLVAQGMADDRVLVDRSGHSVSVWTLRAPDDELPTDELPAEEGSTEDPPADRDHDHGIAEELFAPYAERLDLLKKEIDARTPTDPHLYLSVVATLPVARGRGLGGAMLAHRLADARLPAYLEASTERSRALYLRHGFEDTADAIRLPDGPTLHPMLRPA